MCNTQVKLLCLIKSNTTQFKCLFIHFDAGCTWDLIAMMITEIHFGHHGIDAFTLGPLLPLTWIPADPELKGKCRKIQEINLMNRKINLKTYNLLQPQVSSIH